MKYWCLILCLAYGCKSKNALDEVSAFVPDFTMGPSAMVYKTDRTNAKRVPVLLSDDKSRVVGYPAKTDLRIDGKFPYPVVLKREYYLDKRGIRANTAFLKLSYEEYEKLERIPPPAELYKLIIDKDPFAELCDCGSQKAFKDIRSQLNKLIVTGKLKEVCRVLR